MIHASGETSNRDWWPNELRPDILHQHSSLSNPMGGDFTGTAYVELPAI
jgi:catalase-peroxidase